MINDLKFKWIFGDVEIEKDKINLFDKSIKKISDEKTETTNK